MSESVKKRKTVYGESSTKGEEEFSENDVATSVSSPIGMMQVTEAIREELTNEMQQLLLKAHELSFEYSTLDCDNITQCPLAKKSKELFRVIKRLNELMKKISQAQKPY
uniref:Uncharacterized protein n=1 Tax=Ignisphaera aggregans TaxID=334771 RepID=A0A7J3JRH0_9CREN